MGRPPEDERGVGPDVGGGGIAVGAMGYGGPDEKFS